MTLAWLNNYRVGGTKKRLQDYAYRIVDGRRYWSCNVQFAHDPVTDRVVIIEIQELQGHPLLHQRPLDFLLLTFQHCLQQV